MEIIPSFIFVLGIGYWAHIHISFWKALKKEDPALFAQYSGWSLMKYSSSFAWVELVLTNKHINSSSSNVVVKGNRLRWGYEQKFKLIGFMLTLGIVWALHSFLLLGFRGAT